MDYSNGLHNLGTASGLLMITMEEVARQAGVSVATVSRVLNGNGPVSAVTERRVRQTIQEMGYTPNLSARNLRRNESRVILTLAPNFSNPYYSHILSGIGDTAHTSGYSMLICNTGGRKETVLDSLQMLRTHRADGAIFLGCQSTDFWLGPYLDKFPIVQCCEYVPELQGTSVCIDNYRAAYETVQYLVGLGHQRIGMISSQNRFLSTRLRLEGYRDALEEAGISQDNTLLDCADEEYTFASGLAAAHRLLERKNRPTAIFCVSDILALSAVAAGREMGLDVPADLTVTGFDDVDYTTMYHPYLTTVAQPCYTLGQRSLEILLKRLQEPDTPQERVYVDHRLILRESSGPVPGRK